MTEAVMQAIGVGGPLAIILSAAIVVLWRNLKATEKELKKAIADAAAQRLKDATDFQQKLDDAATQKRLDDDATRAREDEIRSEAKQREDEMRTEVNALYRELNETLKQFEEE